ncbi:MAG: sigma-70 family RNA polymerase sigma factor [Eubacteriales bacterium]|nr:sigma-70 family RNA polymerase sigma factor [Eubacteriales bacterium]HBM03945.1 hypothetical protein [Oscillospiraceae bacterium]
MSVNGKISNDTILSNAKSGDNKQAEVLIVQNRSLVEAIASKYTNSSLEYDDIVQEGMIGLLAAIKTFDKNNGTSFKTYAATCINNSIQTALKKFTRQKDIPQSQVIEYAEEEIPEQHGSISAEDYYIAGESVSMLAKILKENLSDYENEVLRLHIVGCNYNEIANRLSKTPKSVDNALQRIKKKLAAVNFKTDKYNYEV